MTRTREANTYSYLECTIEHTTDKAYFIAVIDTQNRVNKIWVPKSQITEVIPIQSEDNTVILRIADWIIKAKMLLVAPLSEEAKTILDHLTTQGLAGYNNSRMPAHKKEDDEGSEGMADVQF